MWGKICVNCVSWQPWFELPTLRKRAPMWKWSISCLLSSLQSKKQHSSSASRVVVVSSLWGSERAERELMLLRRGCVLWMCPSVWVGVWRHACVETHVSACRCRYLWEGEVSLLCDLHSDHRLLRLMGFSPAVCVRALKMSSILIQTRQEFSSDTFRILIYSCCQCASFPF